MNCITVHIEKLIWTTKVSAFILSLVLYHVCYFQKMATFPKDTIFQTFIVPFCNQNERSEKGIFTAQFSKLLQQLYYITLHDNRQGNENTIIVVFGMP